MLYLLELREKFKKIYQENQTYCDTLYRFLISFLVFYVIKDELNYNETISNIFVVLLLSIIGAFLPSSVLVLLAAVMACLSVFFYSKIIAILVVAVILVLYCLFLRFSPKLGYAIVLMPICFVCKMPCLIPIILGIVATPAAVVSIGCGTIIYYLFKAVKNVEGVSSSISAEEAKQVYEYVLNQFMSNKAVIFSTIVLCTLTIIVYVIRTRNMNHSYEAAIVVASILNMFAYLIGNIYFDTGVGIVATIIGTIFAGMIAYAIQFFRYVLDYSAIEYVQFEDDDYVYYVKAIPKISVAEKKNDVKKIEFVKPNFKDELGFGDDLFDDDKKDNNKSVKADIKDEGNSKEKLDKDEDNSLSTSISLDEFDIDETYADVNGNSFSLADIENFTDISELDKQFDFEDEDRNLSGIERVKKKNQQDMLANSDEKKTNLIGMTDVVDETNVLLNVKEEEKKLDNKEELINEAQIDCLSEDERRKKIEESKRRKSLEESEKELEMLEAIIDSVSEHKENGN